MALLRNRARCKLCGSIIESKHVHDFVTCGCGAISVDGGLEYFRRVGNLDAFEYILLDPPEESAGKEV